MIGGYFVIAYPEDWQRDNISMFDVQNAVEITSGAMLAILHDRDLNSDGTLKKAHYHLLMMWEKNVLPWEKFLDFMLKYDISCPHTWYDESGQKHVEKYHYYTARVVDVEKCVNYMLHNE